jgi:hypothetical protein
MSQFTDGRWESVAAGAAGTILRATAHGARATKVHTSDGRGGWTTQGYGRDGMAWFAAAPFAASNLRDLERVLGEAAADPRALLVAEVPARGADWSRLRRRIHGAEAGLQRSLGGTPWICWEVDGVASDVPPEVDPRLGADRDAAFVRWWLRTHLPAQFASADTLLQWSSSALIGGKISMHLWQWLETPASRESIHAYMESHKRDASHWRRHIDTTIWDGARVHYIADPIWVSDPATDPLAGRRWLYIEGDAPAVDGLPEWVDEDTWCVWLDRARTDALEAKARAAEARAASASQRQRESAKAGGDADVGGALDGGTGALMEVSCLPCALTDLDPKRVLAWARRAIGTQASDIAAAPAGVRHATIRTAGFIVGNILAGLRELGDALSAEAAQRVSWDSGVRDAELASDDAEAAADGSGSGGGAETYRWAVRVGFDTPALPDYRSTFRKAARRVTLPAYDGQLAVDAEVEVDVDGETGEVMEAGPVVAAVRRAEAVVDGDHWMRSVAARPWSSPPSHMSMAQRVLECFTPPGAEPPVADGEALWRYDPARSLWVGFGRADVAKILAMWNDTQTDEDKPKDIKISATDVSGTESICRSLAERPGFFADAPMGIMLRGVFVRAGQREVTLERPSPHHRARWAIDVTPSDDMPDLLRAYLDGAHEGADADDKVRLMGEVLFCALTGAGVRFKKAVMCIGQKGTGKSQFINLLSRMVPAYAQCSIEPQQLGHDYHCAALAGKALNLVSDLEGGNIMREGRFKAIIHGEPVPAREPKGKVFQLVPRALHVFSANALPPSPGASDAFWDRWAVLSFDRRFTTKDNSRGLLGHAVKDIGAVLISEHLPEVLGWAIRCGRDLVARGHYTTPETSQAKIESWKGAGDSIRAWVDDSCEVLDQGTKLSEWCGCKAAHTVYAEWCRRFGYIPVNLYNLKDRLELLGVANRRSNSGVVIALRIKSQISDAPF